jgi:hypothetical protein
MIVPFLQAQGKMIRTEDGIYAGVTNAGCHIPTRKRLYRVQVCFAATDLVLDHHRGKFAAKSFFPALKYS